MSDQTRVIRLTNGGFTLVDDVSFDELNKVNWNIAPSGHVRRSGSGKTGVYMHRFVMNAERGTEIDHINHNPKDNRRCNLRFASRSQNQANTRKYRVNSISKFKGVTFYNRGNCRKWVAQIKVNYKHITLGYFDTELEAARRYDQAAKQYFGEFAKINGV